jgi:hypothetical protein
MVAVATSTILRIRNLFAKDKEIIPRAEKVTRC